MAEKGEEVTLSNVSELRVVDLKRELERRRLAKSGSKKELIDRLIPHLQVEELKDASSTAEEGADDSQGVPSKVDDANSVSRSPDLATDANGRLTERPYEQMSPGPEKPQSQMHTETESLRKSNANANPEKGSDNQVKQSSRSHSSSSGSAENNSDSDSSRAESPSRTMKKKKKEQHAGVAESVQHQSREAELNVVKATGSKDRRSNSEDSGSSTENDASRSRSRSPQLKSSSSGKMSAPVVAQSKVRKEGGLSDSLDDDLNKVRSDQGKDVQARTGASSITTGGGDGRSKQKVLMEKEAVGADSTPMDASSAGSMDNQPTPIEKVTPGRTKHAGSAVEKVDDNSGGDAKPVESVVLFTAVSDDVAPKVAKKRRWGAATKSDASSMQGIVISTESLKGLIPEVKPGPLPPLDSVELSAEQGQSSSSSSSEGEVEEDEVEETRPPPAREQGAGRGRESPKRVVMETSILSRTIFQEVEQQDDSQPGDAPVPANQNERRPRAQRSDSQPANEERDSKTQRSDSEEQEEVVERPKKVSRIDENLENKAPAAVNRDPRRVSRVLGVPTVDEPKPVGRGRSPSPPRHAPTPIVHVQNLVRPYTLSQLKELLGHTGTLLPDGFWIDNVKSHCFVIYETVDQATATRRALHGKQWPLSNPKILRVEFASQEDFDRMKQSGGSACPPSARPVLDRRQSLLDDQAARAGRGAPADSNKSTVAAAAKRDQQGERPAVKPLFPIREWDKDKARQSRSRSPRGGEGSRSGKGEKGEGKGVGKERDKERNKEREREREDRRKRHEEGHDRKRAVVEKVPEEPPAKLLDDLFRKTVTLPCIYWLPLTEEQIAAKQVESDAREAATRGRHHADREQQGGDERAKGARRSSGAGEAPRGGHDGRGDAKAKHSGDDQSKKGHVHSRGGEGVRADESRNEHGERMRR